LPFRQVKSPPSSVWPATWSTAPCGYGGYHH